MKFIAAYLLAQLSGSNAASAAEGEEGSTPGPGKADVRRIRASVGAEVEEDRLDLLFARSRARTSPSRSPPGGSCGAGAAGVGSAASGGAAGAAGGGEAGKDEEKVKEEEKVEEEDDENMFSLFDD